MKSHGFTDEVVKNELRPLISQQKYNVAIKKMFLAAGLTRPVVHLQ